MKKSHKSKTSRRKVLKSLLAVGAGTAGLSLITGTRPAQATAKTKANSAFNANVDLRGTINAAEYGVRPGALDDQSLKFQNLLNQAYEDDKPLFLPPGRYKISNITLPPRTRLMGVPGASRIIYGGDGFLFASNYGEHIEFDGVHIDGGNRPLGNYSAGLIDLNTTEHFVFNNCELVGSSGSGLHLLRTGGQVSNSRISGASGEAGLYAVAATGLSIFGNRIGDCANGGIFLQRWKLGGEGAIVTGNRISNIAAFNGDGGEWGNGIKVFRADGVTIANNRMDGCKGCGIKTMQSSSIITGNGIDRSARGIVLGALLADEQASVISGNIIREMSAVSSQPSDDMPLSGVGIAAETDTTITGNVVQDAPLFGLQLGWKKSMRNIVATGNSISNAGKGIAVTVSRGAGRALISANRISNVKSGNIVGFMGSDPVTSDLAIASPYDYANLTIERNLVG